MSSHWSLTIERIDFSSSRNNKRTEQSGQTSDRLCRGGEPRVCRPANSPTFDFQASTIVLRRAMRVAGARCHNESAAHFCGLAFRVIETAVLLSSETFFAFSKFPPWSVRDRKLGGRIRNISTSMSCVIAGSLIVYQLK